jgi:hypothetical protein
VEWTVERCSAEQVEHFMIQELEMVQNLEEEIRA